MRPATRVALTAFYFLICSFVMNTGNSMVLFTVVLLSLLLLLLLLLVVHTRASHCHLQQQRL